MGKPKRQSNQDVQRQKQKLRKAHVMKAQLSLTFEVDAATPFAAILS